MNTQKITSKYSFHNIGPLAIIGALIVIVILMVIHYYLTKNVKTKTYYYFSQDFANQNYVQNGNIAVGDFMVPLYNNKDKKGNTQGYISWQSLGYLPNNEPFADVNFDVEESITITFDKSTFLGAALRNLPGGFYPENVPLSSCGIGCNKRNKSKNRKYW